jgi:hypothetical protein
MIHPISSNVETKQIIMSWKTMMFSPLKQMLASLPEKE